MEKRERFYTRVEELKERYRQFSTEYLRNQLPIMSITECKAAAKAVLQERETASDSN